MTHPAVRRWSGVPFRTSRMLPHVATMVNIVCVRLWLQQGGSLLDVAEAEGCEVGAVVEALREVMEPSDLLSLLEGRVTQVDNLVTVQRMVTEVAQ